jgi:hypothetical protein
VELQPENITFNIAREKMIQRVFRLVDLNDSLADTHIHLNPKKDLLSQKTVLGTLPQGGCVVPQPRFEPRPWRLSRLNCRLFMDV